MVEVLGAQSRVDKKEDAEDEAETLTQCMAVPKGRRCTMRVFERVKRHGVVTSLENRFGRLLVQRTRKDGADIRR